MGLMEVRSGENGFDGMLIYKIGNKSVGKRGKETKRKAEGNQKGISRKPTMPMHIQVSACGQ